MYPCRCIGSLRINCQKTIVLGRLICIHLCIEFHEKILHIMQIFGFKAWSGIIFVMLMRKHFFSRFLKVVCTFGSPIRYTFALFGC